MKYFAYGSNLDVIQMKVRCPDSALLGKAVLKDYKLVFDLYSSGWQCGVADIVKDPKEKVCGLLFEVSDSDLKNLDHYEGHPSLYRRIEVEVLDSNGDAQMAVTYEVVTKRDFVRPSAEYLSIIKKACKDHSFSDEFLQYINSINAQ